MDKHQRQKVISLIHTISINTADTGRFDADTFSALYKYLNELPDFECFKSGWMQWGHNISSINMDNFVSWLIQHGLKFGPEYAVECVEKFLASGVTPTLEITLLQGISIEESCELTAEFSLVKIEDIPSASFKEGFELFRRENLPMHHQWRANLTRRVVPTCALIRKFDTPSTILPLVIGDEESLPPFNPVKPSDAADILRCLTLLGPSGVVAVANWVELQDDVPFKGYLGSFTPMFELNYIASGCVEVSHDELEAIKSLLSNYINLDPTLKQFLLVPLIRLNYAIRKSTDIDVAIDLGIALEALLTHGRTENDPISLIFRLRAAFFLGESDFDRRKYLEQMFKAIYTLRSKAVHGSTFKEVVKVNGDDLKIKDILKAGINLCAEIIKKILIHGKQPDWDSIMLGKSITQK